jgi:hypothetical protein
MVDADDGVLDRGSLTSVAREDRPVVLYEAELANRRCGRHPKFKGLRKPRLGCEMCAAILKYNREVGLREHRGERRDKGLPKRKKTYNEIVKENL